MPEWVMWIGAFVGMFCLNFMFGIYTRRLVQGRALSASLWSVMLLIANAVVILSYVDDYRRISVACLGAFLGTFAAVKADTRNEKK